MVSPSPPDRTGASSGADLPPRAVDGGHGPSAPPSASSSGYGPLARRVARRTTDLLAIALVLVVALGLGRQLIGWWRSDAVAPVENADTGFPPREHNGVPLAITFGDAPLALDRVVVSGSRDVAVERLIAACASTAQSAHPDGRPPTVVEARLIEATAALEPAREEPGRWSVYVVDGPVVQSVAITPAGRAPGPGSAGGRSLDANIPSAEAPDENPTHATSAARVLCWGLAFPADEQRWIVYVFRPSPDHPDLTGASMAAFLPPGSHRLLTAAGATGSAVTMFEGPGPLAAWKESITAHMRQAGFHESIPSQHTTTSWTTRFEASDPEHHEVIEVHIAPSSPSTLTGILTMHREHM